MILDDILVEIMTIVTTSDPVEAGHDLEEGGTDLGEGGTGEGVTRDSSSGRGCDVPHVTP